MNGCEFDCGHESCQTGCLSHDKRHCIAILNNKTIFFFFFSSWKSQASLSLRYLSLFLPLAILEQRTFSSNTPANWMINDFHVPSLLLKNVFTHWLDPKGHRNTLLVVIFIFVFCLRSSCSIAFHYSGPLAY